jgi:fibronectin type 3 domain-containing protein
MKIPVRQPRRPSSRPEKPRLRFRQARFESLEKRTLLSINVPFYRYDPGSSGVNANETVLTPANVAAGSFGKQFTTPLDGQVLAQPVYMSGVNITTGSSQGTHNVVFAATENDSLYAIDAGSGVVLWHDSFLIGSAGVTVTAVPSADINSGDITPQIGITDTPAIDAANGYLYVVAKTKAVHSGDASGVAHYVNTLYKVNIANATFTSTVIADTSATSNGSYYNAPFTYNSGPYVLGSGDGSVNVGGQNRVYFNSLTQQFRPAVELVNETVNSQTVEEVVLGSASHGDNGPYHGWMLTFNASTLAMTGALNTTPNGGLGGIWQGGDGIVSDPQGYFYFETGNGTFDTTLTSSSFPVNGDYADSFVKVAVDPTTSQSNQNENGWGLKVVDYFTPYDQASLSSADEDLGSGGPTILPNSVGSTAHPYLLVGGGKDGVVYLIDRTNMGKYSPSTNNVVQQLGTSNPSNFSQGGAVGGILSTPAYFNGQVYYTPGYTGPIDAFSLSNGQLSVSADFTTADSFGNLDGGPTVSAIGTANGIVWALERGSGQLRAYNAANLSEIYNSSTVSGDAPGSIMKYTVPMVANGSVFVGTGTSLVMYGLNSPPTLPPAAPSNLAIASFSGSEVSLSWTDNSSASSDRDSAFNIQRSTDDVTFTQIGTGSVNQTTYVDTTVQPFTTYYYRVDASNNIGTSAYTSVVTVETLGQPAVGGGDGLLGQYYTFDGTIADFNADAAGTPLLTRVDPTIDFNWNLSSPDPGVVPQTYFEVVWTGELQAQYSENYTFSTDSDDGVEVFVNGQVVINDFSFHGPTIDTSTTLALQAGKSYAVQVDYFQGGGGAQMELSWSSPHTPLEVIPQSQMFSGSAPAAPANLQVADISGTQTNLTWTTHSSDEDGYEVDRMLGNSGTFSPVAFLPPAANQYLDTGLTPGSTYTYEVRATNFLADSAWSNQAAVTMAVLPDGISSAMPTTVTTKSIAMAWTNNDDNATEIRIFRVPGAGSNPVFITTLTFSDPNEPSSYVDTGPGGLGLLPGTMYGYEVECGNLAGFSAYSSFSVQTLTNAPSELAAVPAAGQVTLSWIAPFGAQTFNIYRGTTAGGESATPLATGVTGTSFLDSSVTNGAQYYYQVTAVDTGGESARSAESSAIPQTPTGPAAAPAKLSATAGDRTVGLAWQPAAGASTYNVYRGAASGQEVLVASGVPGPDYADNPLTDGVTYYYEITSVNQVGESPRSAEVSATPQMTAPPTPINVTATAGNNQVGLSWSPASDALTYNVYRSTVPGNEVVYVQGITGTSYTDTSATNGVTYYYQVSAGNGVGESNLSQEVSATPLPALPAAPASLTATALSSSQISLTWTESAGTASSFTLERSIDGVNFTPLTTLDGTATSFIDSDALDPVTTYYYRLSAADLAGNSAWSSVVSVKPKTAVSSPWADADFGSPPLAGSAYEFGGTVYVNGTGADIYNSSDQFHYVYVPLNGNGTIIAQVTTQGQTDPSAKAGVMIRNTFTAASVFADMILTPGDGAEYQSRDSSNNLVSDTTGSSTYFAPGWVELVRSGSTFTGYVSSNGTSWTEVGSDTLTMNASVYIGLCVTSHNTSLISEATFDEISVNGSTTPTAPGGLTATAASGTSVSLSWTNHDAFSFANEVYRQNPGSTAFTWVATVPANATTFLDTGLTPGDSYSYQILASNTVGNTASNTAAATTPVPPLAVSALQPGGVTTTSALLSWVLNSSNDTGVQIWRRAGGAGNYSLVTTVPAGSTDYADNSLQPGTLYEYEVIAVDLAGSSPAADTGLTTLPVAPVVTATTVMGQVQLSWTASNGAVSYNIYRGLAAGAVDPTPYATINHAASFTDAGVTAGQAYYYLVTAVDFSGESAPSAEVAAAVPGVVIGPPSASFATGGSITYTVTYVDPFFAGCTLSPANVTLNATGTASGTVSVSGAGATRTVTISNLTGGGMVGISIATGTASDTLGNLFPAAGASATFMVDTGPTVSAPASAGPSPVIGDTAGLSVAGADAATGAGSLTYSWATTMLPVGAAAPVFSVNGTHAAQNATATFSRAGSYQFTVTITDLFGLTTTSSVGVTVNQSLTTITTSPATVHLGSNGTQQFSVAAYDQFGSAMLSELAFTWSVASGVGSINPGGLYAAPYAGGSATVTVGVGGITSNAAAITVSDAAPTVAAAATASPGTVSGVATSLSVLGADSDGGGEPNLSYTWSASGPAGVAYSANGDNAAKNATAIFSKAGSYTLTVTITDLGGLSTTSSVTVTVNATPSSIVVSPAVVNLTAGGTQQFSATAYDQFGNAVTIPLTWTLSGPGQLTANGLYSPAYAPGTATVQVVGYALDNLAATANIAITGQAWWNAGAEGSWNTTGNWIDSVSTAAIAAPGVRGVGYPLGGDTVSFLNPAGTTASLDGASPYLAQINYGSTANGCDIVQGSGGTLHLQSAVNEASIVVNGGSQTIACPLQLDSDTTISLAASSTFSITGPIGGNGALILNGPTVPGGGGKLILAGGNSLASATVANGTLELDRAAALDNFALIIGASAAGLF